MGVINVVEIDGLKPLSPLVWVRAFEVHEKVLDRQHRKLLADINELSEMLFEKRPWEAVIGKSRELRDDALEHFRMEEGVLEDVDYADLPQHRTDHRLLERQIREILEHIVRVKEATRTDVEAALFLRSMLVDHFFRKDIAYKSHVLNVRGRPGNR